MFRSCFVALFVLAIAPGCGDATDAPSCANGVLDPGETGVDCGGACGLCPGEVCSADSVCASSLCSGGQCAVATCSDGRQNGTETGVDCGGSCGACGTVQPDTFHGVTTVGPDTTSS